MNLTKILPPRPVNILERERLINRLRAWEDKKLVIIHGQAGQGKSTLAAGYVGTLASPSVWYNIDLEDDNPAVFLSCLGQAIQRACPGRVPKLPLIPQNRYGGGGMYQGIGRWIGQVFGNLPPQSLIVFDDYNISSPLTLQHILKALMEFTPPHIRFMLISRTQPELEIARLRAKRIVGEITGDDLKFSDPEVRDLFGSVFGMQLAGNEVSLVNRTAEGWAAGLVLMHEYFASKDPIDRSASLSRGRHGGFQDHVFDYLAQEVFTHLPAEMQDFLLRTSIVDYLPLPLMELLTALPTAAAPGRMTTRGMVDELRKKNLFVTALDNDATVVRYHALFREFLLKKFLAHARPAEVRRLHTIAARYFRDADDPVRTVNLYLASGQFEQAVRQIETCGLELIARGQTRTLLRWLDALPLDIADRPWFLFYKAVSCRFIDPRTALAFFDRALAGFRADKSPKRTIPGQMLSLGGIIEACFYAGGNFRRMERAAAMANTLLKHGSKGSADARARLLLAIGTAYFFVGRLSRGVEALQQALELFRRTGDHFYQIHSAIYLAPCSLYLGDFRLAREAVRKGFEALESIPDETGGEAALSMAQAMTALFEGSFAEAQECIDKCHGLAHEYDLEAFDFLSLDIGGWLKIATGDYENAEQLLRECKRKGEELENAFFNTSSAHLLAVNYLHQNKLNDALREAEYALAVRTRMGSKLFSAVSLSAIGAIHLKLGKLAQAGRELAGALQIFQQIGAAQQQANVLLLLSRLNLKRKNTRIANQYLQAGFRIGQERGFTYYYLLNAAGVRELARTALAAGICTEYCELLLKKYSPRNDASRIKITCLGGFSVRRGNTLIKDSEWKSRRSKALIKLLVAQDGQKVPRDIIIEALWPGPSSESSRLTLNSMLHRVRKLLEPDTAPDKREPCILQEGNLLGLNHEIVWTDISQFLSHLEAAVRMKHGNERKKAVEEYEKAFALYQGDFLPQDLYEEWAAKARDRIRLACFKALEDAGEISDSLGDKNRAALLYEKLFHADLCNEKACCWLMSWHLAAGQRSEAIRTYERCQRALSRELDVEPDARTKTLYRSIIGG